METTSLKKVRDEAHETAWVGIYRGQVVRLLRRHGEGVFVYRFDYLDDRGDSVEGFGDDLRGTIEDLKASVDRMIQAGQDEAAWEMEIERKASAFYGDGPADSIY